MTSGPESGLTRRGAFGAALGLCLALTADPGPPAVGTSPLRADWTYSGPDGPERWGDLNPTYRACGAGGAQSPIDLRTLRQPPGRSQLQLDYRPVAAAVKNTGFELLVKLGPGCAAVLNGVRYNLVQFHAHTPSEHLVEGGRRAAEWHLVHQDARGRLAVLGVLVVNGRRNAGLAPVVRGLPAEYGELRRIGLFDPRRLLPASNRGVAYSGSLTTPPCSEGVAWTVLAEPIEMSAGQIAGLQPLIGPNARPPQPLNGRRLGGRTVRGI